MSIEKFIFPNEILFRFNDDGTAIKGCHRRDIEVVKDLSSGIVYSAKELDPQPIFGEDMESVLGVINVGLAASLSDANEAKSQLQLQLQGANDSIGSFNQAVTDLQKQLDVASAEISRLTDALTQASAAQSVDGLADAGA